MVIDISNTISLRQLIISVAIFLLTLIAFILAYTQWQKDNFLKTAQEILQAERDYLKKVSDAVKQRANEQEILGVITDFLNKMDLFSLYFTHEMIDKSMVLRYFKPFFIQYWEKETFSFAISKMREENPSAFSHLEDFVGYLKNPKGAKHVRNTK